MLIGFDDILAGATLNIHEFGATDSLWRLGVVNIKGIILDNIKTPVLKVLAHFDVRKALTSFGSGLICHVLILFDGLNLLVLDALVLHGLQRGALEKFRRTARFERSLIWRWL